MKMGDSRGYIENQKLLDKRKGTMGPRGNLADHGCGLITLYNILLHLEGRADFGALCRMASKNWLRVTGLGGWMGVMPWFVLRFLKKREYCVRLKGFGRRGVRKLDRDVPCAAYIILYIWSGKHCLGAHYQAAWRNGDGRLVSHNDYGVDEGFAAFVQRKKTEEHMRWICVWGIDVKSPRVIGNSAT